MQGSQAGSEGCQHLLGRGESGNGITVMQHHHNNDLSVTASSNATARGWGVGVVGAAFAYWARLGARLQKVLAGLTYSGDPGASHSLTKTVKYTVLGGSFMLLLSFSPSLMHW